MACNQGVCNSQAPADEIGAPDLETGWSVNRNGDGLRLCPQCRSFLRRDGGCTRCDNSDPVETASMDDYTKMISDFSQKYGISFQLAEIANRAFCDDGPLGQHMAEKLGTSFSLKDCLEYVAKSSSAEIEIMVEAGGEN